MQKDPMSQKAKLLSDLRRVGLYPIAMTETHSNLTLELALSNDPIRLPWLSQVVNIIETGERQEKVRANPWELGWYLHPMAENGRIVLELFNTNTQWPERQIKTLVWLCGLGQQPVRHTVPQTVNFQSREERLFIIYQNEADLERTYIEWLQIVRLDRINSDHDPSVNGFFCCENHMLQRVQREVFYEWFKMFSTEYSQSQNSPTAESGLGRSEILERFRKAMEITKAKDFLHALFEWDTFRFDYSLNTRQSGCDPRLFETYLCCDVHLGGILAARKAFEARAEEFDDKHGITRLLSKSGSSPLLLSMVWVVLLMHFEDIDPARITHWPQEYIENHVPKILNEYF